MIEMCHGDIRFDPLSSRGPDVRNSIPCLFSGPVREACCVLTGIDYGFTDDDHNLWRTMIDLQCRVDQDVVTVIATFGLRDKSGHWDDRYDASIRYCVLADVAGRPGGFVSRQQLYASATTLASRQAREQTAAVRQTREDEPSPV